MTRVQGNLKKVETVLSEELEQTDKKQFRIDASEETSEGTSRTSKSRPLETPKFKHKMNQYHVNTTQNLALNNKQKINELQNKGAVSNYKQNLKSRKSLPPSKFVDNLINVNQMTNYFPYAYHYGNDNTEAQIPFTPNPTLSNSPESYSRKKYGHAKDSSRSIKTKKNKPRLKSKNKNSRTVMALRGIKHQQSSASLLSQKSNRSLSFSKNREMNPIIQQRMRLKQMEGQSNKNKSRSRQGSKIGHRKSRLFEKVHQHGHHGSQQAIPSAKIFNKFATQLYKPKPSNKHFDNHNDLKENFSDLDNSGFSIKLNGVDIPRLLAEKNYASGRTQRTIEFGNTKRKRTKNYGNHEVMSKKRFGRNRRNKSIFYKDTNDTSD